MRDIKTPYHQSIFDIALQEYGDINAVFQLLRDNSNAILDDELNVDTTLSIDDNYVAKIEAFANAEYIMNISDITVLQNQSLFDISLQEYGDIEGLFFLMKANNLSLHTTIKAGDVIKITEKQINKSLVKFYKENGINPASYTDRTGNYILLENGNVIFLENGKPLILE